jgi:toxin FitB
MNLVDSSGWLEYFADGENASFFAPHIENTSELIVSVINIYEVFKRILQQRDEESALQAVALMQQARVCDVTAEIALNASLKSAELKLPMADSLLLCTAEYYKAQFWTQDADFKNIAGVQYLAKTY